MDTQTPSVTPPAATPAASKPANAKPTAVKRATRAKQPGHAKAKAKAKVAKAKPASKCRALEVGYAACKCGGPLCGLNVTT